MKTPVKLLLPILVASMLGACGWNPIAPPFNPPINGSGKPPAGEPVSFSTIAKSEGEWTPKITDEKMVVINSDKELLGLWTDLYDSMIPMPDPPQIDFSTQSVVAVILGERSTGGYGVEITGITRSDDGSADVSSVETVPGAGCFVTLAFTTPYHIVVTDKINGAARFSNMKEITDCR